MLMQTYVSNVLAWAFVVLLGAVVAMPVDAEETKGPRTGEAAILAALDEKTFCEFVDEPLVGGVVEHLKELHNIEILVDMRALDYPGMGTDFPTTKSLRNVSLRSALNLILRDLDLTWMIVDDVLLITDPRFAEQHPITRVYDVGRFVTVQAPGGKPWQDFNLLVNAITATIAPESWDGIGGLGSIASLEYGGAAVLIVRQTLDVHEQLAKLLGDLRLLVETAAIVPVVAEETKGPRTGEAAILAALQEKTSLEFINEPLRGIIGHLKIVHNIEIQIDVMALADVNLGVDTPVSRSLQNVKLRSALNPILGDLDLTWTIHDEVLSITTPEVAELYAYARVYDVTDLVKIVDTQGSVVEPDFDSLSSLISSTAQPDSWPDSGGGICPFECRGTSALIICQTREVHEEIDQLLADLTTTADKYGDDVFPIHEPILPSDYFPGMGGFGSGFGSFGPVAPETNPPASPTESANTK